MLGSTLERSNDAVTASTVLVVDDARDMRLLARTLLERAGLKVVGEAIDGLDALERIRDLDPPPVPTVILLDNQMPGLTGLEVAAQVLASSPHQIIVLFSGFLSDDIRAQATELGVAKCVSKTDLHTLAPIIKDLITARS
jgi:two-component system chemotaxis response regulator CheY